MWSMYAEHQHVDRENETGFMLFSDRFRLNYPGMLLDKSFRIVAGPDTPSISLVQLKSLLLSKDMQKADELEKLLNNK